MISNKKSSTKPGQLHAPTERATIDSAIHQVEQNQQYAHLGPQGGGSGAWYYGSALPKCSE